MEIPPHLLHETQCVEACRTSNSEMEGFAVFDKQDKRCTCVAKSLRWNALVDNTESDCSSIRYKVASAVSHSEITFPFTQVYDISLVPKSKNCDELFFEKQVFWWEPTYDLVEGGKMLCDWAKPNYQDSEGSWIQSIEKMARVPLISTDRLTHENSEDGIRIGPSVSKMCYMLIF